MLLQNVDHWIAFFLQTIESEPYTIIKWRGQLDTYKVGDDLDIVCLDIVSLVRRIMLSGNQFVSNGGQISIWESSDMSQVHLDLMVEDKLLFRFDLYAGLPHYTFVNLSLDYLNYVLSKYIVLSIGEVNIHVADMSNDLLFKYLEYLEYGHTSPRKSQHYYWVLKYFLQYKNIFLEDIKKYTDMPSTICERIALDELPCREDVILSKSKI